MHVHPSLQDAARHYPNARLCMDIRFGCENLLATCCPDVRAKGVVKKLYCPLVGSWVLLSLLAAAFRPRKRPTQRRFREDICRGRNGRIMDESTQTRSDNT